MNDAFEFWLLHFFYERFTSLYESHMAKSFSSSVNLRELVLAFEVIKAKENPPLFSLRGLLLVLSWLKLAFKRCGKLSPTAFQAHS